MKLREEGFEEVTGGLRLFTEEGRVWLEMHVSGRTVRVGFQPEQAAELGKHMLQASRLLGPERGDA